MSGLVVLESVLIGTIWAVAFWRAGETWIRARRELAEIRKRHKKEKRDFERKWELIFAAIKHHEEAEMKVGPC
jgi:hypothetical protein